MRLPLSHHDVNETILMFHKHTVGKCAYRLIRLMYCSMNRQKGSFLNIIINMFYFVLNQILSWIFARLFVWQQNERCRARWCVLEGMFFQLILLLVFENERKRKTWYCLLHSCLHVTICLQEPCHLSQKSPFQITHTKYVKWLMSRQSLSHIWIFFWLKYEFF